MLCSLRCFLQRTLLIAVAACFFSTVIIALLRHTKLFATLGQIDHVLNKEPSLVVHRRPVVVQHKTNCCSTGNIYYNETASQTVRNRSHDVHRIFSGMVTSNMVTSMHTANLVQLGKQPRKSNGSLKHVYDQFTKTTHAPALSRNVNQTLFHSRELVIWSTDHHPAPAYDTKYLLQPLGVKFLQHDLSPYCSYFNVCQERNSLKVSSLVITNFDIDV